MPVRGLPALGLTALCAILSTAATVAPATATTPARTRPAVKSCASPSSTGDKASRYNTTPKGHGPWQVPLDPCNTEAYGSGGKTPYYNCAYWAAEKRPDVWVNAVWKYATATNYTGAWSIHSFAKKAHYPINHQPKTGDLAIWPQNVRMGTTSGGTYFTASSGGHIAYVEKALAHGRVKLSTMGESSTGGMTMTLKYNRHKTFFIHHLSG